MNKTSIKQVLFKFMTQKKLPKIYAKLHFGG